MSQHWPIITEHTQPSRQEPEPPSGVAIGVNRQIGEGGFWAKIVFQDTSYPWRYAFVQQHRGVDPTAIDSVNNGVTVAAGVRFFNSGADLLSNAQPLNMQNGAQITGPPGQGSLFTVDGNTPFKQAMDVNGVIQNLQTGQVVNWAEEVFRCESVPIGAIIWMRGGENYVAQTNATGEGANFPRDDYTFQWSAPVYAKITGYGLTASSDSHYNGDHQWSECYRQRGAGLNANTMVWAAPAGGGGRHSIVQQANQAPGFDFPVNLGSFPHPAREANGRADVPIGSIVQLFPGNVIGYNHDGTVYSQEWIFFYEEEIHYAVAQADWQQPTGTPNLPSVVVSPCDDALGNGVNTAIQQTVYFLAMQDQDPAVFEGDIITYRYHAAPKESTTGAVSWIFLVTSPGSYDDALGMVKFVWTWNYGGFHLNGPPEGWHECDGSTPGDTKIGALPDTRGLFLLPLDTPKAKWDDADTQGGGNANGNYRGVSSSRNTLGAAGVNIVVELEDVQESKIPIGGPNDVIVRPPAFAMMCCIRYK